jgi:melibiose permease
VKFAGALSGFFIGIGLSMIGYVPNVEQSEETIFGLRFMMVGTPLIMILLSVWIYKMQYKLHGEFQSRVMRKIARAEVV